MSNITNLLDTSTFGQWLANTNALITFINSNTVATGQEVFGHAALGNSSQMTGSLAINGNTKWLVTNTAHIVGIPATFAANVSVNSTANIISFSPQATITFAPGTSSIFNTLLRVNTTAQFVGNVSANAALTVVGAATFSNTVNASAFNTDGPLQTRQILFVPAAASISADLGTGTPQDNYAPAGFANAQILHVNTSIDATITGFAAPESVVGRLLFLQNTGSHKITLKSNTGSSEVNRITTPGDADLDILPGGSLTLLYSSTTQRWRPIGGAGGGGAVSSGNTSITGTLAVSGNASFGGTTTATGLVNASAGLAVSGAATFANGATFSGNGAFQNVTVAGTLGVTGIASFSNTINVNTSTASFIRNLQANNVTATQTMSVPALTVSGTAATANLTASGSTTLSGALQANTATFAGLATFNANAAFANITFSGTLSGGTISAGAITGTSLAAGAGAVTGASLAVSGAITGASLNVGTGAITSGAITSSGAISGTTGTFSGAVSAVSPTFTGTITAAAANFSSALGLNGITTYNAKITPGSSGRLVIPVGTDKWAT